MIRRGRPEDTEIHRNPEAKFFVVLWELKSALNLGLNSTLASGCPCSIKCLV